jgi:hypothetical protein
VIVATEAGATKNVPNMLQLLEPVEPKIQADKQVSFLPEMFKDEDLVSALEIFCNDNDWGRIWMLQEISIGHNVQFLLGDTVVAASNLRSLLRMLKTQPRGERWSQAVDIFNIRELW